MTTPPFGGGDMLMRGADRPASRHAGLRSLLPRPLGAAWKRSHAQGQQVQLSRCHVGRHHDPRKSAEPLNDGKQVKELTRDPDQAVAPALTSGS